jgi:hypothetical protein
MIDDDDDDDYSSSSKNRRIADLSLSLPFLLSPRQPSADTPRDDDEDEDDDDDDDVFKKFPRPRRAVRYRIRSFQSPQNPTPRIR